VTLHPLLMDRFWPDDPIGQFFSYYRYPVLAIVVLIFIASRTAKKRR
jgi:hypothetical protein